MFTRHRNDPPDKLNCPHAMGTNALSPQRAESFRHILLLPPPSLVYNRRKLPNLRISLGARAAQFQASGLRVLSHARACSRPAQRTTRGYVQRSKCRLRIGSQNPHPNVAKSATLRMGHPAMQSISGKRGTTISTFEITRSLWKSCAIFIEIR